MKAFWRKIRNDISELRKLDERCTSSLSSGVDRYSIGSPVAEYEIQAYEKAQNTRLPDNYRAYLQYFGSGGVGPDHGIFHFPKDVWQGDLSKPLNIEYYSNLDISMAYVEIDETDGPLFDLDSMIRIGSAGEAQNYLVVSGELSGRVICWMSMHGLLWVRGSFDHWYEQWVEKRIQGLREFQEVKKIKIGMHINEIESNPALTTVDRYKNGFLYFNYTHVRIKLDVNQRVQQIFIPDEFLLS